MHQTRELTRLGLHKASLRRRITRRRNHCIELTQHTLQPIGWLERALSLVQKISPLLTLAAIPLVQQIQRSFFPRQKRLATLLAWAPAIWSMLRQFR